MPRRPLDPLPEARRDHARDGDPAGHDRRHRAGDRFGPRLPGLAALPRPGHPRRWTTRRPGSSGSTGRSRRSSASGDPGAGACSRVVDHRDRPSLLWPSFAAVGLVGFQAWLGRETVRLGNSGESVTAHLAAAMVLVGLLVFLTVRARVPGPHRRSRREPAVHAAGGLHRRWRPSRCCSSGRT